MTVVYVVDDDRLVTESLSRALQLETDWEVRAFNDGARALESMPALPPDVVLSDFKMPGMDGIAFLRKVRAAQPDAVLILLTGYADKESAIRAINEVGIWQYVEKPWDLATSWSRCARGWSGASWWASSSARTQCWRRASTSSPARTTSWCARSGWRRWGAWPRAWPTRSAINWRWWATPRPSASGRRRAAT